MSHANPGISREQAVVVGYRRPPPGPFWLKARRSPGTALCAVRRRAAGVPMPRERRRPRRPRRAAPPAMPRAPRRPCFAATASTRYPTAIQRLTGRRLQTPRASGAGTGRRAGGGPERRFAPYAGEPPAFPGRDGSTDLSTQSPFVASQAAGPERNHLSRIMFIGWHDFRVTLWNRGARCARHHHANSE